MIHYNRQNAVNYSNRWALGRNPAYYDFSEIGGDCTSFISQCIYAGCGVMNYTPVMGWYYRSLSDRTPSWTGVQYLYNFLVNNKGAGPSAKQVSLYEAESGDVIQLEYGNAFYHSLFITEIISKDDFSGILINAHTTDSYKRPLSSYLFSGYRVLHIIG